MRRLTPLLVDMDGTLLRLGISSAAMDVARTDLRGLFLDAGVEAVFKPVLAVIRESLVELQRLGGPVAEIRARAYGILDDMEEHGARRAAACVGAAALLEQARAQGRPLALVTNNGRRCVGPAFDAAGLPLDAFTAVVTRDDVAREKPYPDPIVAAIRRLDVAPRATVVMTGDTHTDMRCARAAAEFDDRPIVTVAVGEAARAALAASPELVDWHAADLLDVRRIVITLDAHRLHPAAATVLGADS